MVVMQPATIFCGDRHWADERAINAVMVKVNPRLVIEGDASGADRMAGTQAAFLGIAHECYPANWEKYGKPAGPIRNRQMLERLLKEPEPRLVVAFHDDLKNSRGTQDMVNRAKKARIAVKVVRHKRKGK